MKISLEQNDQPIEIIIPRDPNMLIKQIFTPNITQINSNLNQSNVYLFRIEFHRDLHFSNSFHLQLHPPTNNISYLLFHRFDRQPISSFHSFNHQWTLLCPQSISLSLL